MRDFSALKTVPKKPGLYCLLGEEGRSTFNAYVGISGDIRGRLEQHLIRRDSSTATGVKAAALLPDHVRGAIWWVAPEFDDVVTREAAELVAFDLLEPTLRSRGRLRPEAKSLAQDEAFRARISFMLEDTDNRAWFPSITDLYAEIRDLRSRIEVLETAMSERR